MEGLVCVSFYKIENHGGLGRGYVDGVGIFKLKPKGLGGKRQLCQMKGRKTDPNKKK